VNALAVYRPTCAVCFKQFVDWNVFYCWVLTAQTWLDLKVQKPKLW